MVGPEGHRFLQEINALADGSPSRFLRILSYGLANLRTRTSFRARVSLLFPQRESMNGRQAERRAGQIWSDEMYQRPPMAGPRYAKPLTRIGPTSRISATSDRPRATGAGECFAIAHGRPTERSRCHPISLAERRSEDLDIVTVRHQALCSEQCHSRILRHHASRCRLRYLGLLPDRRPVDDTHH